MKKIMVISGINIFEGGPLSIYYDCIDSIKNSNILENYTVYILVHKKNLFENYAKIYNIIEIPKSRKNYVYRLYYEYYYFNRMFKNKKIDIWFSIHDMTPCVKARCLATYCHNSSPFYKIELKDFFYNRTLAMFALFYKFLYGINIKKNRYVVVQQQWIANEFKKMYHIDNLLVAPPSVSYNGIKQNLKQRNNRITTFIYPSLSRSFKNHEIICKSLIKLNTHLKESYEVIFTINGTENRYSKDIYEKYKSIPQIKFIGLIPRADLDKYYELADCLVFPSKLETWGLPITEFKQYNKPILAANLLYAHETVGKYEKVNFFNPNNIEELAGLMESIIKNKIKFEGNKETKYTDKFVNNWNDLMDLFCKGD